MGKDFYSNDIKSIAEYQKEGIGAMIRDNLKLGWTFNTWYEKIILFIITVLAMWKIGDWIF